RPQPVNRAPRAVAGTFGIDQTLIVEMGAPIDCAATQLVDVA
ncbi:MAG: hypothetical protein RLZZ554_64, partial [Actinomycetota bacterium]